MRTRRPFALLVSTCVAALALLTVSCAKDSSTDTDGDDGHGCGPDISGAHAKVVQANTALERVLYDELNPWGPDRPNDVDLQEPNRLYAEALVLDACNLDAHFGVAVTGLLTLSNDAEVNAAFDEWKAYLDDHVPFEVPESAPGFLGVPVGFARGREALRLPFDLVPLSVVTLTRSSMAREDPKLGRVQAILEERVLPRLQQTQEHLLEVLQDSTYVFMVTGRMMGDEEEDPVEVDRTDILALRAGCSLLAAACRIAVSYQVEMAAYDSVSLDQAFHPGSGWMALRPGGAVQMQQARVDLLSAVEQLEETITSLLNERDSQDYDVIKIGPDDLSRADVESVRVNLPHVEELLENGYTRIEDWDDDSRTPETSLRIDFGGFLRTPVADWKALLPAYTHRIERRVWDSDWRSESGSGALTVDVPDSGYFASASFNQSVEAGEVRYTNFYGDDFLRQPMEQFVHERLQIARATPHWNGEFSGIVNFRGGNLQAGSQPIAIIWYTGYGVVTREIHVPVLVWEATSFQAWTWPDPTFRGLLPEMSNTAQLMSTLGFTEDQWEREWELDWSGSGGHGTVPPNPPPTPPPPGMAIAGRAPLRPW